MTSKQYKLTDLVIAAGGLSSLAYAKGARLERTMTAEEKLMREASLRTQQIALYEESMQSENKNFDLARADSLLTMKLDLGNTFPVAIDLEEAMAHPEGSENVLLREGDRLIVPQYSSTVKISGDVMYPTSMNFKKGKSLKYYIKRAGGYGDNARKSRVYAIYMNGSVELLSHHSKSAVQPGCEIVVPSAYDSQLRFKRGARVVLCKSSKYWGYVNGDFGTIEDFNGVYFTIRLDDGNSLIKCPNPNDR